jgi:hypothetical protein
MSTCLPTGRKDLSIFKANFSLLNKFLMNFTLCFTKKQMAVFVLVIYALFKDYKRNSLETMAKSSNINYQKLQCFMSDSKWDIQVTPEADSLWRTTKQKRLEIIQKQRTTTSTKDGLIVIDGTERPKPFAKKLKVLNGNTANLLKEKKSATLQSPLPLSHKQNTSLST